MRELREFDLSIAEKLAFSEFTLSGRQKALPSMVVGYFKHYMCSRSALVETLRATIPLPSIEAVVAQRNQRGVPNLTPVTFMRCIIDPLVGRANYVEEDALALFDYFDVDADGEIDYRDLCNGFVLLRSKDGAAVPVIHRCVSMVTPRQKRDTRLLLLTRLELLQMARVIEQAFADIVDAVSASTALLRHSIEAEDPPLAATSPEMRQLHTQLSDVSILSGCLQQLRGELQRMLDAFGCDRTGAFPYDAVQEFMRRSDVIRSAVSLMRVPRDEDLHLSFLSEFFRTSDADEKRSNRDFRPNLRMKAAALLGRRASVVAGGLQARRKTLSGNDQSDAASEGTFTDYSRPAPEHEEPQFYTMKGVCFCRTKDAAPVALAKCSYSLTEVDRVTGVPSAKDRLPSMREARWAREAADSVGGKLLLGFGGNARSLGFAAMCSTAGHRARFLAALDALLEQYQLDGVDYNWEYPASDVEWRDWGHLMRESKERLLRGKAIVTFTMYLDPQHFVTISRFDLLRHADYVHCMAYDQPRQHSTIEFAQSAIRLAKDHRFPLPKFTLGLPFYGRHVRTGEPQTYAEIYGRQRRAGRRGVDLLAVDQIGEMYFNSQRTIHVKTKHCIDEGLGGVMVWELGQDVQPCSRRSSLMTGIQSAALAAIAQMNTTNDQSIGEL
jgi:hypothetical protein